MKKRSYYYIWIENNKILFILLFLIYDAVLNSFLIIPSFEIKKHIINDEIFYIKYTFGNIIIIFIVMEKYLYYYLIYYYNL